MKNTKEDQTCIGHFMQDSELMDIKSNLEKEKKLHKLSKIFKAIGDQNRLKIIYVLSLSPLCVCDIADLLDMTQSSISHHLKVLRDLNLVKFERQGKLVVYSLDDFHVLELLQSGLEHTSHLWWLS